MSTAQITIVHPTPEEPDRHWRPSLTRREAARIGIPRDEYERAAQYALMAADVHQRLGTPRERWEPTPDQNHLLADPFITDGERELSVRLEAEADSALDKAHDLLENAKANLDELRGDAAPFDTVESGSHYSAAQAVERVQHLNRKIEQDETVGKHHHRRANLVLQRLAAWAPWVEAAGFLTFIAYYLNVAILQPWRDWLGWSFAATAVVGIITGQTWLVNHAARSHNHAREARAEGNRHEAEHAFTRRNWYLAATAVTAAAITGGMIWRATAALGKASGDTIALMVFIAAVTGLLLPTLIYLGLALDGSKVSRERDGLAADLDDDLEAYLEGISNSCLDLARVAEISDKLKDKTFPDICNTTQEAVDPVYRLYGTVRLLIGGLSAEPLPKTSKTIVQDAEGNIHGYIGTSISGTRKVHLDPLFDRWYRLVGLERQRTELLNRVDALPAHPWGTCRTG
jgi:hypothetical protein